MNKQQLINKLELNKKPYSWVGTEDNSEIVTLLDSIIDDINNLDEVKQVEYLKKVLFCIGEIAVSNFDEVIVCIVDTVLDGYKMESREAFDEFLKSLVEK